MIVASCLSDRQRHTKAWLILNEVPNLASSCQLVDLTVDGVAALRQEGQFGHWRSSPQKADGPGLDSRFSPTKMVRLWKMLVRITAPVGMSSRPAELASHGGNPNGDTIRGINLASSLFTSAIDPVLEHIPHHSQDIELCCVYSRCWFQSMEVKEVGEDVHRWHFVCDC
jgi:hypothetical protein